MKNLFETPEAPVINPIRILLVDDNPYFLEAARDLLQLNQAIQVVAIATEGQDALIQVPAVNPDVILLDLNLGDQSGLALIPQFKKAEPGAKIIILTIMEEEPYRIAALQAGANAFVCKTQMSKTLIPVIFELTNSTDSKQRGE